MRYSLVLSLSLLLSSVAIAQAQDASHAPSAPPGSGAKPGDVEKEPVPPTSKTEPVAADKSAAQPDGERAGTQQPQDVESLPPADAAASESGLPPANSPEATDTSTAPAPNTAPLPTSPPGTSPPQLNTAPPAHSHHVTKASPSPVSLEVQQRTKDIDEQILALKQSRPTFVWPIVTTAAGFVVAGAAFFTLFADNITLCDSESSSDCGEESFDHTIGYVIGGLGLAAGVGGAVWLIVNASKRRRINRQIRALKIERSNLMVDVAPRKNGAYVSFRSTF